MAKREVTVPDIGGAEGAEVIEVLVAVGDQVAAEQGLIVLESDKASMEIPSDVAGTVIELRVREGEELAEGAVIAVIDSMSDDPAAEEAGGAGAPAASEDTPSAESEPGAAAAAPAADAAEPSAETAGEITVSVPDIGTEEPVDLTEISVAVGDNVAEGDSLVVLESDKASMEVPAPAAGEITAILVEEGVSVREGDPLVRMRSESAGSSSAASAGPGPANKDGDTSTAPVAQPAKAAGQDAGRQDATAAGQVQRAVESRTGGDARTVYAGPAVRKLARELGVDLGRVTGTGPRGRLVKEDLHAYVQSAMRDRDRGGAAGGIGIPAVPEVDFSEFGPVEVIARSKLDRLTAVNMHRSWLNVPHVTQFGEADITDLEEFRSGLKAEGEARGVRLTPLPFLLKACAVALRDAPKFRASLVNGGDELAIKEYIHIGMAVDTPAGLFVPVIRDVDQKSLWQLAEEVVDMASRARERQLKPAEMRGGCFTVSSLGNIGGTGFTPIVNTPEVGILGVSQAEVKPVWDGSTFVPRKHLPLSLSYDHRVINGGDAGRFMTHLTGLLSDIRRFLL